MKEYFVITHAILGVSSNVMCMYPTRAEAELVMETLESNRPQCLIRTQVMTSSGSRY